MGQVRARTGSGKTAAFALPLLQKILRRKEAEPGLSRDVRAVILVPTRELCEQVRGKDEPLFINIHIYIFIYFLAIPHTLAVMQSKYLFVLSEHV